MKNTRTRLLTLALASLSPVAFASDWDSFTPLPGSPNWVETGSMLGLVEVTHDPFIWIESLGRYGFVPWETFSDVGAWVNVPFAEAEEEVFPVLSLEVVERSRVADNGLFFANNFQFGRHISAHGNAMAIHGEFIYVGWYMGGMENRHVMLSRRHFDSDTWETIQFPHRHIGFRGDPTIGDSHNSIAVGISPIDETVHLLYDMHAYTAVQFPDDFFNYNISVPGAATAEEWTLDLFYEKRNYLRPGENYERVTYPSFNVLPNGHLMARWRVGGSTNGSFVNATYNGEEWSTRQVMTFGGVAGRTWGLYGSYSFLPQTGKWHMGFSIRADGTGVPLNSGFYYAETEDPSGLAGWRTVDGQPLTLPIIDPAPLKIGEPTQFGVGDRIPVAANWTVTENGSIHFRSTVSGTNVHYFRGPQDTEFTAVTSGVPNGGLSSFQNLVLARGLEDGRFTLYATPAGRNDWQLIFADDASPANYQHGIVVQSGDYIFFFGQHAGSSESLPLDVIRFRLSVEE